jgi:uncharacterized protein YbbK (DUF523 family)
MLEKKENVLFSRCFLGVPCRYHGRIVSSPAKVARLSKKFNLIPVCPEHLGGLPVPRPLAPLKNKKGEKIFDILGNDLSLSFKKGALQTLEIAKRYNCKKAYLCKNSPSCDKRGFAGELLEKNGIKVINL